MNAVIKAALDLLECDNSESAKALLRAFSGDSHKHVETGSRLVSFRKIGEIVQVALTIVDNVGSNMSGRLHLNWTGKGSMPRLETRSIETVSVHPETSTTSNNLLIHADNLLALQALLSTHRGRVKQVVIDPPYNVGYAFADYDDNLAHSAWLGLMRDRLVLLRDLLTQDGSIWIFIDDDEMAYLQVLCDEIFGRKNRVANVIWQKKHTRANDAKFFSDNHDYILVYAKSKPHLSLNMRPRSQEAIRRDYSNPDNDPRGLWTSGPMHVKTPSEEYIYPITTPGGAVYEPVGGTSWRFGIEAFHRHVGNNDIYFGIDGNARPRIKRFLDRSVEAAFKVKKDGIVPNTVWLHTAKGIPSQSIREIPPNFLDHYSDTNQNNLEEDLVAYIGGFLEELGDDEGVGHTDRAKAEARSVSGTPFSTPKPELLLQRIIHLGSNEGDFILDSFAGSGTTGAVAHKMRRKWILVEVMQDTVDQYIIPRLRAVVDNAEASLPGPGVGLPSVVNERYNWNGGGDFKICRLLPSLLTYDEDFGIYTLNTAAFEHSEQYIYAITNYLGFEYIQQINRSQEFIHGTSSIGEGILHVSLTSLSTEMISFLQSNTQGQSLTIICTTHTVDDAELQELQRQGVHLIRIPVDIEGECDWGVSGYLWFNDQQVVRDIRGPSDREIAESIIPNDAMEEE